MRSPYVQFWESIPAAERTGKRPFHLRQGCPDADHQRGVGSSMPPGRLCNYTVKEEIGRGFDNGHNTATGEEIKIWKIATEEEAEAGRSIEQESHTQQTMQRNKSNKYGVKDRINVWW
ncbi:hypothetical protein ACQJBY_026340 [Aegilops geniculata]